MTASDKTHALADRIRNVTRVDISFNDAWTLRRAEKTLQRWSELECGDGNDHASWSIERDEVTDKPYMVTYPHVGSSRRRPVPDRERGAIKRVAALCERLGLHYFHQTDPRGCSLYVAAVELTDNNYSSRGVACCD